MFKHILLPTDGSPLSEATIRRAVEFAKSINARVTGFHVVPDFRVITYRTDMLADTRDRFEQDAKTQADKLLAVIQNVAKQVGVPCDVVTATSDDPYDAIIKAAQERNCDLIVMASHGKRGLQGVILGSETQKVLTHSKIPVLVFR